MEPIYGNQANGTELQEESIQHHHQTLIQPRRLGGSLLIGIHGAKTRFTDDDFSFLLPVTINFNLEPHPSITSMTIGNDVLFLYWI